MNKSHRWPRHERPGECRNHDRCLDCNVWLTDAKRERIPCGPRTHDHPVQAATDVLFANRHRIPGDVIRSLQSILFCAEAALYGEPEGFEVDPEDYAAHDVTECEDSSSGAGGHDTPESAAECDPWTAEAEQ